MAAGDERLNSSAAVGRVWWCVLAGMVGVWGSGAVDLAVGGWFAVGCGLVGIGIIVRGRLRSVALVLAVGALMAGYTGARVGLVSGDRVDALSGVVGGERAIVKVRGVVVEGVEWREGRGEVWEPGMWAGVSGRCLVRVEGVMVEDGWMDSSGVVRVVLNEEDGWGVGVGDVVEVLGMMRGNAGSKNFGGMDWVGMANMEGRAGVISVVGGGEIEVIGRGGGVWNTAMRLRGAVRDRALRALGLDGLLSGSEPAQVVLGALILGERSSQDREVERSFARVGVGHVLAISGFHVALLVGVCVLLLRVVGVERMWVEGGVICLVLVLMWVLVPVRVPMVRAMVLIGALMLGRGLGRRYDTMAVLGWVAIGLMVWRPLDVLGLGWVLSVGVTGLLVWMGRGEGMGEGLKRRRGMGWAVLRRVWDVFRINGACWLLAMPVIVLYVGTVSVVGFVMAAVVAALAGVLMVLGYVQVLVGVVWPGLGEETLFVVEGFAGFVAGFVGWVDGVGGGGWSSVRGMNLGVWWTIVATGLIWLVLTRARVVTKKRVVVACVALVVWGGVVYRVNSIVDGVRVEMVDVGDGSAYLVRSGNETMLYDCGSLDYRVGRTVERVAWARGIRKIDAAIISHDNLDHFNGLVDLVRSGVGFERVYVGEYMEANPSAAWSGVRAELVGYGVEIVVMGVGDGFDFGGAFVECVGGGEMRKGFTTNDTSLVVRVSLETDVGELAVMFTGDIGAAGIGWLADEDLEGVVAMELPHHGSMNGAVRGLVELVDPMVVLQSTGVERVDGRWAFLHEGRGWYASGGVGKDGGAAWVEIRGSGEVLSGWVVGE